MTTTFSSGLTVGGSSTRTTPSSTVNAFRFSFDPTSATQVLVGTLPAGSRVIDVVGLGGATGGTTPTVILGTLADDDGFAAQLDADAKTSAMATGTTGALLGALLTVPTPVYGKVGSAAATGGTKAGFIQYTIEDL